MNQCFFTVVYYQGDEGRGLCELLLFSVVYCQGEKGRGDWMDTVFLHCTEVAEILAANYIWHFGLVRPLHYPKLRE